MAVAANIDRQLDRNRQPQNKNINLRTQSLPPQVTQTTREEEGRKDNLTRSRDDLSPPFLTRHQMADTSFPSSVKSPEYFLPGDSSLTDGDNNRMYKIKSMFHTAWGPRKFSGKRLPGEEGIIALLTNMNRAQYTCPVTEAEFVTFLAPVSYTHLTLPTTPYV